MNYVKKAHVYAKLKSGIVGIKVSIMLPDTPLPDRIKLIDTETKKEPEAIKTEVKEEKPKEEALKKRVRKNVKKEKENGSDQE